MTTPTYSAVSWTRHGPILDQGSLGSGPAHAGAGMLGSEPFAHDADDAAPYNLAYVNQLYSDATRRDILSGTWPPTDTGTTNVAVCKVLVARGLLAGYQYSGATNTVEALLGGLQRCPVLVGTLWYSAMNRPDAAGFVRVSGTLEGGNQYLCREYVPGTSLDLGVLTFDNCWGTGWGLGGSFKMRVADMRLLLSRGGDVVAPIPPTV